MLGVWDYTVILTYISFISAGIGIFCAISMHLPWAIFSWHVPGYVICLTERLQEQKRPYGGREKVWHSNRLVMRYRLFWDTADGYLL